MKKITAKHPYLTFRVFFYSLNLATKSGQKITDLNMKNEQYIHNGSTVDMIFIELLIYLSNAFSTIN